MNWPAANMKPYYLFIAVGIFGIGFSFLWFPKIRQIMEVRAQVADLEVKLRQGQDLWKRFPPLSVAEKRSLEEARARLVRNLSRDRNVPPLLQEISRLARDHGLVGVSIEVQNEISTQEPQSRASGAAPGSVVSAAAASRQVQSKEAGPIGVFAVRLNFLAGYRDIAHFLESLNRLPRLVRVHSLTVQRGVPLVTGEILLHAYHQRGDLPPIARS